MRDTIEQLEAIGRDASLRHAPSGELSRRLQDTDASPALMAAVASGDRTRLFDELGHKPMHAPNVSQVQTPGHEEDEPDDDDGHPVPPSPGHDSPARK